MGVHTPNILPDTGAISGNQVEVLYRIGAA